MYLIQTVLQKETGLNFSVKQAASVQKAKIQNNVSEWEDMSTCGLLFQ